MPGQKISELTSLAASAIAGTDVIPIVDISTDTTKKITFGDIQSALNYTTRPAMIDQAAVLATMPAGTIVSDGTVEYIKTTGATTIPDFAGWLPYGKTTRQHFASDADFDTATGYNSGNGYPVPYLTKHDLPPQQIDIMGIGVIPSNLAGDATNNVNAIQEVIDWLNSKTNGGIIVGNGFSPSFSNPIIGINAPIVMKQKVSFRFSNAVRFRATQAMETMVDTPAVGSGFITGVEMLGGFWDAGQNADRCFRIKEFQDIAFGGPEMTLHRAKLYGVTFGDAAATDNPYGLKWTGGFVTNHNSSYGSAVAAVQIAGNLGISDSDLDGLTLIGYPVGITGKLFGCRVQRIHSWSFPLTQGPLQTAIEADGGRTSYIQCQSDNPSSAGFKVIGGDHYRFSNCTSTMGVDDLPSYTGKPDSGTIPVFDIASGVDGVSIKQCFGNDRAGSTFGTFATGDLSDVWIDETSYSWHGPAPIPRRWGWPDTFAQFTTNAGSDPTVVASRNVASVTRFGDADYSITIDENLPSTQYIGIVEATPVTPGDSLTISVRTKAVSNYRIQVMDETGTLTRPAALTIKLVPLSPK